MNGTASEPGGSTAVLLVLCASMLMIAMNATVVNVTLTSIASDLDFSPTSIVWVVTGFSVAFGGSLLIGGRLGDLFGHRRLLLLGIELFTLASICCALAPTATALVAARCVQGVGGAFVSAAAFSLTITLFTDERTRAKALGTRTFVSSAGSSVGLLLGGALGGALSWNWIFLANASIGVCVYLLCRALLPLDRRREITGRLDVAGAVTVTVTLMLGVGSIVNAGQVGWVHPLTLTLLAGVAVLGLLFVRIEQRAREPIMRLNLFRRHETVVASVVGSLLAATLAAWSVVAALYLQRVLHVEPLGVAAAFLPGTLLHALVALRLTPVLIVRYGAKVPLVLGLLAASAGLAILARTSLVAGRSMELLPAIGLLGLGIGLAYGPLILGAMRGVAPDDTGAVSSIVNTSVTVGGVLGLSVLASFAASRTQNLLSAGHDISAALRGGYGAAFILGAALAVAAALTSAIYVRNSRRDFEGGSSQKDTSSPREG